LMSFFLKQSECIYQAYIDGTCELKLQLLECNIIGDGWDCIKVIPEVKRCLQN
jgi:hypothetical protein